MAGFSNPLFAKPKAAQALKAQAEDAAASGAIPPRQGIMAGGGMMGTMLKGMGLNPEAVDETAQKLIGGLDELNARLARIETQQDVANATLAKLADALAKQAEHAEATESMVKAMLAGLAQ